MKTRLVQRTRGTTDLPAYTTGFVTSQDGTTIGYRQLGEGPGVIAIHGGMQAGQSFMRLAAALAGDFTVYLPDRRGRGLSGPPGEKYNLLAECQDMDALLAQTGAHNAFGLSSGAIVALQSALTLPAIRKVALYEPPLSINHSTPMGWVTRYDREVAQGDLAAAMITAMNGTQTGPPFLRLVPRCLSAPLINHFITVEAGKMNGDDVPMKALIPTLRYDAQLVFETQGTLDSFKEMPAEVLLLGGSKSGRYLKTALDGLGSVLPKARRVELPGVGHLGADNSGQPGRVAQELRGFFKSGG
jgi:pimeloyl-ACP methyl ester carboxylesterase